MVNGRPYFRQGRLHDRDNLFYFYAIKMYSVERVTPYATGSDY
jgi:hypothetical protein